MWLKRQSCAKDLEAAIAKPYQTSSEDDDDDDNDDDDDGDEFNDDHDDEEECSDVYEKEKRSEDHIENEYAEAPETTNAKYAEGGKHVNHLAQWGWCRSLQIQRQHYKISKALPIACLVQIKRCI